jgi:hypothetical protein
MHIFQTLSGLLTVGWTRAVSAKSVRRSFDALLVFAAALVALRVAGLG